MSLAWCDLCAKEFKSLHALRQHVEDTPGHERCCWQCDRWFVNDFAIEQHYQTSGAHRGSAPVWKEYRSPMNSSRQENIQQAQTTQGYGHATYLPSGPSNRATANNNKNATHPIAYPLGPSNSRSWEAEGAYCKPCNRYFTNIEALEAHLMNNSAHCYCQKCHRDFVSSQARDEHFAKSSKHKNSASFDTPNLLVKHVVEEPGHNFMIEAPHHSKKEVPQCAEKEPPHYCDGHTGQHFCTKCNEHFRSEEALIIHMMKDPSHFYCLKCGEDFGSEDLRINHFMTSVSHYYCGKCHKDFLSDVERVTHWSVSQFHHFCPTCAMEFGSEAELLEHWQSSTNHAFCLKCLENFPSTSELKTHYEMSSSHYFCTKCGIDFDTTMALASHLQDRDKHHWCWRCELHFDSEEALRTHYGENPAHNVCLACNTDYASPQELIKHQIIHQPRIKACACSSKFSGFFAMMVHWETGTCITNARDLHRLVLRFPEHEKLVVLAMRMHLQGTIVRIKSAVAYHFDQQSGKYVCPFDGCGLAFEEMALLDQHLKDPLHDFKVFRCPGMACDGRFSSLSSLIEHVDSKGWREGIDDGRACLGKLWTFLMKELGLSAEAPTSEEASDSLL